MLIFRKCVKKIPEVTKLFRDFLFRRFSTKDMQLD